MTKKEKMEKLREELEEQGKKRKRMEKLREELKREGINVSDDALFIVSELREEIRSLRNFILALILPLFGILCALIIGFGIAILSHL